MGLFEIMRRKQLGQGSIDHTQHAQAEFDAASNEALLLGTDEYISAAIGVQTKLSELYKETMVRELQTSDLQQPIAFTDVPGLVDVASIVAEKRLTFSRQSPGQRFAARQLGHTDVGALGAIAM